MKEYITLNLKGQHYLLVADSFPGAAKEALSRIAQDWDVIMTEYMSAFQGDPMAEDAENPDWILFVLVRCLSRQTQGCFSYSISKPCFEISL